MQLREWAIGIEKWCGQYIPYSQKSSGRSYTFSRTERCKIQSDGNLFVGLENVYD